MGKQDLRIVYMGTPEFVEYSLRVLVERGYNIVGVVTMPDKPSGRGKQIQCSAVKRYAESQGLPVLQPEKLKDEQFLEQLRALKADLQIVVAFRMLPEVVWSMPRLGTFNLHGSLLPQYRGAAPINWAIINGDKETGVTTFFLKHEIDTGDMILQEKIEIGDDEDAGSVHDRLMVLGADVVCRTTDLIIEGNVKAVPQPVLPSDEMRPAPKIFTETCEIDFGKPANQVHDFVRGLSPHPAAWCELELGDEKRMVKLFKTSVSDMPAGDEQCGSMATDGKRYLRVRCSDRWLDILELQLPGKRRMATRDVLNGLR